MGQPDNRRRVPHVCPNCGCIRRLKPADAAKTKQCQRCHCKQIAPLGFAATAARKGRDFAIHAAARKRKLKPEFAQNSGWKLPCVRFPASPGNVKSWSSVQTAIRISSISP